MRLRKIAAIAVAGFAAFGVGAGVFAQDMMADPAIADMSVEQLVEARQDTMKQNGGIMKGAGGLSGADAVAAAETLHQNFINFTAMFPEGSIADDSKALPVIWEDKEAFDALFMQAAELAGQMKSAAESGDMDAFGAAAKQIGGLCGQCHQKYRAS